jgi:ribosomal protein L7/L12
MPAFNEAEIALLLDRIRERLGAIEDQLALVSEKAGVPYDKPGGDLPEDVVQLARAGKRLEAIKRYREITGASGDEAREVVGGI